MKQTPLILSIIALVASAVFGILSLSGNGKAKPVSEKVSSDSTAVAGSIVYFNADQVISGYDMANDLRSVVETKLQGIQSEIDRRGKKIQSDYTAFQQKIDKGLLTQSVAQAQAQKLEQQRSEYENYAVRKQNEMAEEQQVMMNQIMDAINTYILKFNAEKQYALILATQGNILPIPVVTGDDALDITEELLKGLNEEYIKTKGTAAPAEK
jgi:outer membrane protein